MKPIFLTVQDVIEEHEYSITHYGGSHGLRDKKGLESAVNTPPAFFGGFYLHSDLYAMAAAYLFHIVKNHPFFSLQRASMKTIKTTNGSGCI